MVIVEDDFWKGEKINDNTFYILWKEKASDFTDTEFQEHLVLFTNLLKEHKITNFIVDTRKGHPIMNIEIQKWHDDVIVPIYLELVIEKMAFIQSEDIFTSVSLEQTFEEEKGKLLNIKYFNDEQSAIAWITN